MDIRVPLQLRPCGLVKEAVEVPGRVLANLLVNHRQYVCQGAEVSEIDALANFGIDVGHVNDNGLDSNILNPSGESYTFALHCTAETTVL
jgi:hypothetical protein